MKYDFKSIESKWQNYWSKNKTFKTVIDKNMPKYYVLDMFPYPSGSGLHVGHPLGYIASDIISRFKRKKGFNVLHPMGFDSFGLPAEQYAIKTGKHPKLTTEKNIKRFKNQLNKLGLSYDWDREIKTSDSNYYKWTQWIFLKLYNSYFDEAAKKAKNISELEIPEELNDHEKIQYIDSKRLAYLDNVDVNWCEELGTVLSNEEVIGGLSERGGHTVIRKPMRQWVMRITAYANRLLDDLELLDWPESIKLSQKNWIGKSEGAKIRFTINKNSYVDVFTTRPDTIYGATYLVLAPENELSIKLATTENRNIVENYILKSSQKSDLERQENIKDKTGVFTGSYAINPISKEKIPIWIADYVLSGYGTGAVMAVPGHDERDFQFAEKFNLKILSVVSGGKEGECYTGNGKIINSEKYNGLDNHKFKKVVCELLEDLELGKKSINYKLRDWIFTRQRYWGEPIPIMYDGNIKVPLSDTELPLILPDVESFKPTGDGSSPLARNKSWKNIRLNGKKFQRETNTMPQWAGSCWYFLRFLDPTNGNSFADKNKIDYWMPVDVYIGGAEHAVLHLLYSRFWHKVLYDLGFVSGPEPFKKLVNQGMILGNSAFIYRIKNTNTYISYDLIKKYDVQKINVDIDLLINNNELNLEKLKNSDIKFKNAEYKFNEKFTVSREIEKMSKSKFNVVSPDQICEKYGADTLRMYEMFLGPIEQSKPWNTAGISGVHNFLKKFWSLYHDQSGFCISYSKPNQNSLKILHKTIKKVNLDIEKFSFNTCVSAFMICVNELSSINEKSFEVLRDLCILMSPFAPHVCEEIWSKFGESNSISNQNFPTHNELILVEDEFEYPISFNGKLRLKMIFKLDCEYQDIEKELSQNEKVNSCLNGKKIKKIIFVKNKIINIVF